MILREFLIMGAGNLWRMKLRTALTVSGVVIGIGAMVSMLSFAFGMQRNVATQFRSLGLFHTLQVMPGLLAGTHVGPHPAPDDPDEIDARHKPDPSGEPMTGAAADSSGAVLSDSLLARIGALKGVSLVYPQDTFDARFAWRGQTTSTIAQSLPARFGETALAGRTLAGRFFGSDSAHEAVLSLRLVKKLGANADSILGDTLDLKVAGRGELARGFLDQVLRDLELPEGARALADQMARLFLKDLGASEARLVVCGVAELEGGWGFRQHDLLVPSGVAARLDRLSFSNPLELLARLSAPTDQGYPLAVVNLEEQADHQAVRDSIEALGLRTLSFVDEFERMRRQFLVFDLFVGVIGFIALFVASLGIVNTMVMSILERTREIGILKSLGAQDGHVRLLFLVESALIGLLGSLGGLLLGWVISRVGSFVVKRIMVAQELPPMELFHLPVGIACGAIAFGVAVSLAAGLYPATRAARIDPVLALRHD